MAIMKDIIASQHVKRRSKPSLLSTAQNYKAMQQGSHVSGNSFIADQYLPKRKKKPFSKSRKLPPSPAAHKWPGRPDGAASIQWQFPARLKSLWKGRKNFSASQQGNSAEKMIRHGEETGFLHIVLNLFAHLPRKFFFVFLLCLSIGCFALILNYIPEPEPPEDKAIRELNLRPDVFDRNGGDEIPLDVTETFAWQSYTVRSGDSVEAIARRFDLSIDAIIASNDLRNVKRLRSGEKIRIPNMDGIPYKIKSGDSYSKIAHSFGVPLEAILDANDIQSDSISIDTVLFIPGARMDRNALREALGELFIWPISGKRSSGFGWRNDPFTGVRSFHAGLDISGPIGLAVKASADGRVSATGFNAVYGNFIIITHSSEFQTMYAHLSKILVKTGTYVNQGEIIGQVGNTGRSTGSHLHFAVYKNKRAINPLEVLNQ